MKIITTDINNPGPTLIHYGSTEYSRKKFDKIKNDGWVKPRGGLWTSPIDSEWSWKHWCEAEQFRECVEENSFKLEFKEGSKIYYIDTLEDLKNGIFTQNTLPYMSPVLDYEKITKKVDAIWLTTNGQWKTRLSRPYNLYGWDCETVLILKFNCVKQIGLQNLKL